MIIRKLAFEDLQIRVNWMNNPNVYRSMHYAIPIVMENTIRWYNDNIGSEKRIDLTFEENNEIIAFGGLTNINREINKAELYIFVNPFTQKKGFGTRATMELCRYGFEELSLDKIYLETNEDNYAAQRVYEKCGFVLEGKLRNEYKSVNGTLMCRMYYGLLKGELHG